MGRGGSFGSFASVGRAAEYEGRVTWHVVLACIISASGGLLFGYDIGISRGVTSMDDFLVKFFPSVYITKHSGTLQEGHYYKYSNQGLQLFTSSLYLAAMVATYFASLVMRIYGRKITMLVSGSFFLVGSILNVAAMNLAMLIIGRILLGVGVGFATQAVPVYLLEMAPSKYRGAFNIMFQMATTIGNLVANLINYGTNGMHPNGWRVSLGLAAVPTILLCMGGIFCYETPNSLVERGHKEEGREVLNKIRGTQNVMAEYNNMVEASEIAKTIKDPFRNILQPRIRPQFKMMHSTSNVLSSVVPPSSVYRGQSYHQLQEHGDDERQSFIVRHSQAQVCHGEGVGIIASQSINLQDLSTVL